MKKRSIGTDVSAHQTVTDFIKLENGPKTIQIGFTDQKISAQAGLSALAGFLQWQKFGERINGLLPKIWSNNAMKPKDVAIGFMVGIITGAKKLTQAAHLRDDPALPVLFNIDRIASESTFSRFFARFQSAAQNLRTFDPLWRWSLERLSSRPGGYTLDLDSTQLLHEQALQCEGVRLGHTPKGIKRCYNPLIAFLAEPKLVAGFWLRPGNTVCHNNAVAFTVDILDRLPRYIRIGLVRADSGLFEEKWLQLLEERHIHYIVVGRLREPMRHLLKAQQVWQSTDVKGTEVAEVYTQQWSWARLRRAVLIRHRLKDKERPSGKLLIETPGYGYQVLVTSLGSEVAPIEVWRRYNGRAGCENIIKELDANFALPQICLENFWSTEAALSLSVLTYNLCMLFQRHLAWKDRVSASTLRFRLFSTGAIVSRTGGRDTVRLAVPPKQRPWWRTLLDKLSSPFPNCNAVEFFPAYSQ